jgi:HEAT repeat protein
MGRLGNIAVGLMFLVLAARPGPATDPETLYEGKTVRQWLVQIKDGGEHKQFDACQVLKKVGGQVVTPLGAALRDRDPEIRSAAAFVLGEIGPAAKSTAPGLIAFLQDGSQKFTREMENACGRWTAAYALGRVGAGADVVAAPLMKALRDPDEVVRWEAAESLGLLGAAAKGATTALSEALRDKEQEVREKAAVALGNIGPGARAAVPCLRKALKDEDSEVRQAAARALQQIEAAEAGGSGKR